MHHAVTPYGRAGPSSRVRVHSWLERVQAPVVTSSYLSHRNSSPTYLLRHPRAVLAAERRLRRMASARPSHLLLHREASPLSRGGVERRLLECAGFSVYDVDDALHEDRGEGGLHRKLAPKAPKADLAARRASRVIAGNPTLAEWASGLNDDVVLIPSCVDPGAYTAKADYALNDPPRLGWIGSPDNEVYLGLVGDLLTEVNRRTGARLTLIGTTRESLGELERLIDRVPWSEQAQHSALARFDVGLAPLPDDPYSRGKCGYRLLQLGAAGVPVVGSPVGVNRSILAQFGMPAAETATDWLDGVVELLTASQERRAELGRRARAVTEREYSYDVWLEPWCEATGFDSTRPAT
jgi:glycosyltransferase involved in cell wall biosynthesis